MKAIKRMNGKLNYIGLSEKQVDAIELLMAKELEKDGGFNGTKKQRQSKNYKIKGAKNR